MRRDVILVILRAEITENNPGRLSRSSSDDEFGATQSFPVTVARAHVPDFPRHRSVTLGVARRARVTPIALYRLSGSVRELK